MSEGVTTDLSAVLPVSPEVRVVTLANGFRCWIRRNLRPHGAVLLCLTVRSGSLNEEEHQRGLAHFVEHLAFRGTEHFPPGAAEGFFASMGTRLGTHHNATTSLEQTCYTLFLPLGDAETVDRGILCLADIANRMSFLPDEVEAQRRVILEEMRSVRDWRVRLRERAVGLMLPGARVARRHPLGTEEVVRGTSVAELRSFHAKWYRPDNTTLFVVGEVDADVVEGLVRRHLGGWCAAAEWAPDADPGINESHPTRAAVLADPGVTEAQLSLLSVAMVRTLRTVGHLRARRVERLACWIMSRRLGALVQLGEAPFREGLVTFETMLGVCAAVQAQVSGAVERAYPMLESLARELRRARTHGVLDQEMEVGRASVLNAARQALLSEPNRSSGSIVEGMHSALADGRPPMSRAQSHALITALVQGITKGDVKTWLEANLAHQGKLLLAVVPVARDGSLPTGHELLRRLDEAETGPVAAPAVRVRPGQLLERTPAPGAVAAHELDPDLGIFSGVLDNGVRLHLREMDFKRRRAFVRLTIAGGRLQETEENLGITMAASLVGTLPASTSLDSIQIREWMAGRGIVFSCAVEDDCITIGLVAEPGELENGLQLLHLLLTRPLIESVALERWQEQIEVSEARRKSSLEARLAERSLELLSGSDPRLRPIAPDEARRITIGAAQQWLERMIAGPVEAAIVGDLSTRRALELALTYLGSLPDRPVRDPQLHALRELRGDDPSDPRWNGLAGPSTESTVWVASEPARAAALTGWRTAPWAATRERHLLEMAERIAGSRLQLELRERQGLTYHADCSFRPSRAYPRLSLLAAGFLCSPADVSRAQGAARKVIESLAASGPTEDEMEATRKQFVDSMTKNRLEPGYWCQALSDLEYRGTQLEELKDAELHFRGYTRGQVQQVLARYVTDERLLTVIGLPTG